MRAVLVGLLVVGLWAGSAVPVGAQTTWNCGSTTSGDFTATNCNSAGGSLTCSTFGTDFVVTQCNGTGGSTLSCSSYIDTTTSTTCTSTAPRSSSGLRPVPTIGISCTWSTRYC